MAGGLTSLSTENVGFLSINSVVEVAFVLDEGRHVVRATECFSWQENTHYTHLGVELSRR